MLSRLLRFLRAFLQALFRRKERLPRQPGVERRRAPARRRSGPEQEPPRQEPARREGALAIEYGPRADGSPDPGEIVWAWVPYEDDPRQGKDRPVLLIGRRGRKLVGVALTSKPDARYRVEVGAGPWDREGRVSYAKVDRLIDLDPAQVRREGAVLDRRRFERVVAEVEG